MGWKFQKMTFWPVFTLILYQVPKRVLQFRKFRNKVYTCSYIFLHFLSCITLWGPGSRIRVNPGQQVIFSNFQLIQFCPFCQSLSLTICLSTFSCSTSYRNIWRLKSIYRKTPLIEKEKLEKSHAWFKRNWSLIFSLRSFKNRLPEERVLRPHLTAQYQASYEGEEHLMAWAQEQRTDQRRHSTNLCYCCSTQSPLRRSLLSC